jgi:hypothetical protein
MTHTETQPKVRGVTKHHARRGMWHEEMVTQDDERSTERSYGHRGLFVGNCHGKYLVE